MEDNPRFRFQVFESQTTFIQIDGRLFAYMNPAPTSRNKPALGLLIISFLAAGGHNGTSKTHLERGEHVQKDRHRAG